MEEILHHLGCIKPCKLWDINRCQLVQDFFHQPYDVCPLVSSQVNKDIEQRVMFCADESDKVGAASVFFFCGGKGLIRFG